VKVTIIGGAGGMGKWFSHFFLANGNDVRIIDKGEKTAEIANQLDVEFFHLDVIKMKRHKNKKDEIVSAGISIGEDTDVLLISVPIDVTAPVIERVGPEMPQGSLIMDVTSVKRMPVEAMRRFTPEGVEILGTHPLFGPTAKSMRGQTVIFVPLRKGRLYREIYQMYKRNGARIEFLDAEKHDQIMAVVQGLAHFVLIALGITLKDLNFEVQTARRYMSPMYDILMDFVGRILNQDPHLYAQIQTYLDMKKIHETFLSDARRLYQMIVAKNVDGFMEEMQEASKYWNTEKAIFDSDRVIEQKIKDQDQG
jgi:prephenate dehydrogenase